MKEGFSTRDSKSSCGSAQERRKYGTTRQVDTVKVNIQSLPLSIRTNLPKLITLNYKIFYIEWTKCTVIILLQLFYELEPVQ